MLFPVGTLCKITSLSKMTCQTPDGRLTTLNPQEIVVIVTAYDKKTRTIQVLCRSGIVLVDPNFVSRFQPVLT